MLVCSILLVIYAFEVGPLESNADSFARKASSNPTTAGASLLLAEALPWLLVIPAVLLFGWVVWLFAGLVGLRKPGVRKKKKRPTARQERSPFLDFKASAERQGVRSRTAFRTWKLLEELCHPGYALGLNTSLNGDLGLGPAEARTLHLRLLSELSRPSTTSMRLPEVQTVLQLMQAVESVAEERVATAPGQVVLPGDPGQHRKRPPRVS